MGWWTYQHRCGHHCVAFFPQQHLCAVALATMVWLSNKMLVDSCVSYTTFGGVVRGVLGKKAAWCTEAVQHLGLFLTST